MNLVIVKLHLDPHGKLVVNESVYFQFMDGVSIFLPLRDRNGNIPPRRLLHGTFIKQGMPKGITSCDALCQQKKHNGIQDQLS